MAASSVVARPTEFNSRFQRNCDSMRLIATHACRSGRRRRCTPELGFHSCSVDTRRVAAGSPRHPSRGSIACGLLAPHHLKQSRVRQPPSRRPRRSGTNRERIRVLARLSACTPRSTCLLGQRRDHRAQQPIDRVGGVEHLGHVGLQHDGHRVLRHPRRKPIRSAPTVVERVFRPQLVRTSLARLS